MPSSTRTTSHPARTAWFRLAAKAYGLPQDTGPLVYFYNKAEFEKLGITEIPQTAR